jgi:hypothetical protein
LKIIVKKHPDNSFPHQVVTLVLYTYFIAALMGRQMVPNVDTTSGKKYEDPDLYFPLFTALQASFPVKNTLKRF